MSSWEAGPPHAEGAGTAPEPAFATVFRGYDPRQVLEYLTLVAGRVQALEAQVKKLDAELQQARRENAAFRGTAGKSPYEGVSARVADLVRTFDQDVEKLRGDAEKEIQRLLGEARAEADRIRLDAQSNAEATKAQAERALREAQQEADKSLSDLGARREALRAELRAVRDRMLEAAGDLGSALGSGQAEDPVVIVEDARTGSPE